MKIRPFAVCFCDHFYMPKAQSAYETKWDSTVNTLIST